MMNKWKTVRSSVTPPTNFIWIKEDNNGNYIDTLIYSNNAWTSLILPITKELGQIVHNVRIEDTNIIIEYNDGNLKEYDLGEVILSLFKWIKEENGKVIIDAPVTINNNSSEIILAGGNGGQSPLARFKTNHVYGGFIETHIDGDGAGAGGGLRFYHKGTIRLQVLTGNPDYAYSEGTTFDVLDGNLVFSVRKPEGLIKFNNSPSKGTASKITFNVNTGSILIKGDGPSQIVLENQFTPTSSNDSKGVVGSLAWDDSYLYIKTQSGWKRNLLETF